MVDVQEGYKSLANFFKGMRKLEQNDPTKRSIK
jgi:hypothetical protein